VESKIILKKGFRGMRCEIVKEIELTDENFSTGHPVVLSIILK